MEVLVPLQCVAPSGCMVAEATFAAGCTDSGQGVQKPWEVSGGHTAAGDTLPHLLWDQLWASPGRGHAWTGDYHTAARIRRCFTEQGIPGHVDKLAAFQKVSAPGLLFPNHLLCYFAAQGERCFH